MTAPADRLLAAADLLDELAGEATEGPWFNTRDGEVKNARNWDVVDRMGAGSKDARYIALMGPDKAEALAKVFRAWAKIVRYDQDLIHRIGGEETLALADLLLAGAP